MIRIVTDRSRFQLTPEQMAGYRATLAAREAERRRQCEERARAAWHAAARAADLLRDHYGAIRVVVYGSLARGTYGLHSDVDLAVWGVDDRYWLAAPGDVHDMAPEFELNLVLAQEAKPRLLESIHADGVDI